MTAPDARQPDEKWRIGTSWGIHVYQGEKGSPGERPVATFHDPADAQRAVDAVNGADLHAGVLALADSLEAEAVQVADLGDHELDEAISATYQECSDRLRAALIEVLGGGAVRETTDDPRTGDRLIHLKQSGAMAAFADQLEREGEPRAAVMADQLAEFYRQWAEDPDVVPPEIEAPPERAAAVADLHAREFAAEELFVLASRLVSQDVEDMRVYDEIRALRDALTDTTGDPA